jgi:hypothetical protein
MWTRQYSSGYWSDWQRFVGADELTTGTLVPFRSLNADKAKNAKKADEADKASEATRANYDAKNRPLETALNCEYEATIKKGVDFEGYSVLSFDKTGTLTTIPDAGIISFVVLSVEDESTANFIMDLRHGVYQTSCVFSTATASSNDYMSRLVFSPLSEIIEDKVYYKYKVSFSNADITNGHGTDALGESIRWKEVINPNPDSVKVYYKYLLRHPNGFPAD